MTPCDCPTALDRLHARLDGDAAPLPDGVRAHLDGCPACRERFRAADRLRATPRPRAAVPPLLTERIVAAVRRDAARRRRQRLFGWSGAAVAAGVALWLAARPPAPRDAVAVAPPAIPPAVAELPPRLDVGEVGDAVVAFSKRTAADVAGGGWLLLPELPIPATLPAFAGSARPLDEARAGLAESFEPVATSAKRAFGLVWRDFGTGGQ